ncbi:MAG: hypothetical protein KBH07_05085 [Flavobacteriales bacterium]|nr:hypothetical protein [Flavobacteriales bacterium]MBP9079434.1 hypothetical protein [Flavobacteriales bacterium]
MKLHSLLLSAALMAWAAPSYAQGGLQDTSILLVPLTISYAYQLPSGDLAQRFGANSNLGFSASVKFKSNYSLGLEGGYLFGNNVQERNVLREMTTGNGVVVNQDGEPADILLFERGYTVMAFAGKVIPIAGPNPNSGILLKLGAGYMAHKLLIQHQNDVLPALEGDYLKGYDRLSAGPVGMFFAGYQHLGNSRFVNFMVGFELQVAFTRSMRPYNFDSGRADEDTHVDGLSGLRAGWTFPIYKTRDNRQYYR